MRLYYGSTVLCKSRRGVEDGGDGDSLRTAALPLPSRLFLRVPGPCGAQGPIEH
jgi:hypothetical protein